MAKGEKDKEFGKWQGTTLFPRKASIKRFEHGFIIKNLKTKEVKRVEHKNTTYKDMSLMIERYIFWE